MSIPETDIDLIAKGWNKARHYCKERLRHVYELDDEELANAVSDGRVVLETVCLFVHACLRGGQYRVPLEFWRILQTECGITVYPSALTEEIDIHGVGRDRTFMDAYEGHITMHARWTYDRPFPDPLEYLKTPPPAYQKECPRCNGTHEIGDTDVGK